MNKSDLLESASKLKSPPEKTISEYAQTKDVLAEKLTRIMRERRDLETLIGTDNLEMMEQNHRNHVLFMESLFRSFDPKVFVETVLWVFRSYRSHGFKLAYFPAKLDNWVILLQEELSPAGFEAIYPFYQWMIVNQPYFAVLSDPDIAQDK